MSKKDKVRRPKPPVRNIKRCKQHRHTLFRSLNSKGTRCIIIKYSASFSWKRRQSLTPTYPSKEKTAKAKKKAGVRR